MNTLTFSNRDNKIIKDNPGKTAYELLMAGLSKKAFSKLVAALEMPGKEIEPLSIETTGKVTVLRSKVNKKFVLLRNLRTEIVTRVSNRTADMLLRIYPKEYKTL